MGGKAKQAQRTKGNLKPASSSKASEQLDTLSFTPLDMTITSSIVSGFTEDPFDIDSRIDPNFQMVLRKMGKKDPTTKIKALKEFIDLVGQADNDTLTAVLPFFPKVYIQLSCDVDARVRESSQSALQSIVNKVGKNLAMILKQIFPAWVCGQYDTHPTAASIATNCFEKAFPAKKISDVFVFCETETLDYITKNLTVLTAQTACNPKIYSPEECEAKYQRIVISSLRGYALYLEKMSSDKLESSMNKNFLLIENDRFWSYHKSKVPQIKSAFFEALSSLLQHASYLLVNFEEQMTAIVFKSIDETDAALLSHIWTCVVLVQVKVENWYKYVNFNKAVFPKLWKILHSSMCPCVIFPNLLPFLSKFNKSVLPDDQLQIFYLKFYENIKFGLINNQMGKSETSAVSSAYFETLQYIIIQIANDSESIETDKLSFCLGLLDEHVIAVIFWCINAEGFFGKFVFHHIANMINYFSKTSSTSKIFESLLNRFWSELYQVLSNSLETTTNIEKIANSHVELIKSMKSCQQRVRTTKIKFDDVVEDSPSSSPTKVVENSKNRAYEDELNKLVYKICNVYTERISSTHEIGFVENLEMLIKEYQSEELFRHLAKWNNPDEVDICSLYDTFSAWLLVKELRCESIVEIILVLYKYLKPSEKIDLLNRWIRVPSVQSWIIMRALSYPLCIEPDISKLLQMQEVKDHMIHCARQASNGIYKENLIILQKYFFQTEDSQSNLIDSETCEKIIEIMCEPLTDVARISQMDQCGSFLAQILPVICADSDKKSLQEKIFLALFEFSMIKEVSDDLSEDTLWEVTTAWQDALSSRDLILDEFLLNSCTKIIQNKLENLSMEKISLNDMERVAEVGSKLIMCSTEQETPDEKKKIVDMLIKKILKHNEDESVNYMENLCLCIELMHGDIISTTIFDTPPMNFTNTLDTFLKHKIFNLDIITKLSCNIKKVSKQMMKVEDDNDDVEQPGYEIEFSELQNQALEEEATEDYCDMDENLLKEWSDAIYEKFHDICYSESILNVILTRGRNIQSELENWIIYLQERLETLMKNLPENISVIVKEKLFELANVRGGFWTRSLMNLLNLKCYNVESGISLLFNDLSKPSSQDEITNNYLNIIQSFSERIDKKSLTIASNLFENHSNLIVKVSIIRSLMRNHLNVGDFNEMNDRRIVGNALNLMNEILSKQKSDPFLLYNKDISMDGEESILIACEIANFLSDVLSYFPNEVDVKRWDFIRIALSSWVLSVSKSCHKFHENKVKIFISSIFRLNATLFKFITIEKTKSSTEILQNVIDEWEKVFAKEVNLVLIKSFILIIKQLDYQSKHQECFVDSLCPSIDYIDFNYILQSQKVDSTFSLKDLIVFSLENLSNNYRTICVTSATIIKKLTFGLIKLDQDVLIQRNSEDDTGRNDDDENLGNYRWHILDTFRDTLEGYQDVMKEFIEDFNFKLSDMDELSSISQNVAFSYLLLWDCILNFCSKAPAELRSIYAKWITVHHFEDVFLVSLFKLMPRDIVRNPEAQMKSGHVVFSSLEWKEIEDLSVDIDRYAAFLYAESLRTVPAVVRKWWHVSNTRQAQIVEKITQNYVSPILCQQDLTVLMNRKEKDGKDNMQVKVLMQSREIFATYSLEEAKMELTISLPANYPLGAIKIESTKHIAGKFQAREIVKQLSIYLTHQNGRLYDGISLWKRNLDRKYEGVEECYVCYSVINQDTCQLPRLTCKTCKKKFHSNCLYKWFTSSNKSTCPLCRNVF